ALPGWRLAAGGPSAGHPPPANLLRPARVLEIQDHHNIADIAFELGRDVGVAPVEREPMDSVAAAAPRRDLLRLARIRYVVDAETDRLRHFFPRQGRTVPARRMLAIDQHDAVRDADLMGMDAGGGGNVRDLVRLLRIAHVDDGRAGRLVDVADIGIVTVDHDLPAAIAIEI